MAHNQTSLQKQHPLGAGTPGGFLGLRRLFDPKGFAKDFASLTTQNISLDAPNGPTLSPEVTGFSDEGISLLNDLFGRTESLITGQHRDALQGILDAIPQDFDAQRAAGRGQITQQANQLSRTSAQQSARRGLSSGGGQASTASTNLGLGANLARQSLDQDIEDRQSQVAQFKAAIQSNDLSAMTQLLIGTDAARTFGQVGIQGDLASATQAQLSSDDFQDLIRELSDKLDPNAFRQFLDIIGGFASLTGRSRVGFGLSAAGDIL